MTAPSVPQPACLTPIIPGFHPDPTVCRVGDTYYLATSSFEYAPGVPLWRSDDLVTWELVTNVFTTEEQLPAGVTESSSGIYAATLRHRDGTFWLITTNVRAGATGHVILTAQDPAGPWSAPVVVGGLNGIDPDIAWDDDGTCLVTYCASQGGDTVILQAAIDPASGAVCEPPRLMWSGTGLAHPEAPHLYKRGDWWYLMIAEGGTERGHTVAIARARDPRGPFTASPANPILSHRSLDHPVQNTGHGDLVRVTDDEWAMVYLAVRPRGVTPGFHVNGRETFLAGVTWDDGWPVVDESRYEIPAVSTAFCENFTDPDLHARWVSPGHRPSFFVDQMPDGSAVVSPATAPVGRPSLLCVRCLDPWWRVRTTVTTGDGAVALALRMDDRHWLEVRADAEHVSAVVCIGGLEFTLGSMGRSAATSVTLELRAVPPTTEGPDDVVAAFVVDGRVVDIGSVDGRYLSTEVAGGFTGRVVGVRAIDSAVTVNSFEYVPLAPAIGRWP